MTSSCNPNKPMTTVDRRCFNPGERVSTRRVTSIRYQTGPSRTLVALLLAALSLALALPEKDLLFKGTLPTSAAHRVLVSREAIYHKVSLICSLWNERTAQVTPPLLMPRIPGNFYNRNEQATMNNWRWWVNGKVGSREVHWIFEADTGRLHLMTVSDPLDGASRGKTEITAPEEASIVARHLLDVLDLMPAGAHLFLSEAPHRHRRAHDWRVTWKIRPAGSQPPYYVRLWIAGRSGLPQEVEVLTQAS